MKTIQDQIPYLYMIAYKYTKESVMADDLVQETVYKALKNMDKFKKGTNLKAWLSTILRNNFINEYRKKSKYFNTDNIVSFVGNKEKYRGSNNGYIMMQVEFINQAIDELPMSLKEPFMLCYEGFSYTEISEKLELPLGTVKSRIFHARTKLKEKLVHLRAA